MDIQAALKNLINQRVNVDQSHTDPPGVTGVLVEVFDGFYAVEDDDGLGEVTFDWSQVELVQGYGIRLEDPAWENEVPPDEVDYSLEPILPDSLDDDWRDIDPDEANPYGDDW